MGIEDGGLGPIRETSKLYKSDQRGSVTSNLAGQPEGRKFLDPFLMIIKFWSSSPSYKVKRKERDMKRVIKIYFLKSAFGTISITWGFLGNKVKKPAFLKGQTSTVLIGVIFANLSFSISKEHSYKAMHNSVNVKHNDDLHEQCSVVFAEIFNVWTWMARSNLCVDHLECRSLGVGTICAIH